MNRIKLVVCLTAFVFVAAGCGDKAAETKTGADETIAETAAETTVEAVFETESVEAETSEAASVEGETNEIEIGSLYEDNFGVPEADAEAYAERIKAAVAEKDLEALADLTAFPVYVGLPDIGGVETRDDLLNIGEDKLLTDELMASVEGTDTSKLTASMAGFVLSDGSSANIIFGVVNGELAVTGINY